MQARKKLCDVYDGNSLTERQCQRWFARFRSGDFDIKDAPRSGRPTIVDDDKIKAMLKANRHIMRHTRNSREPHHIKFNRFLPFTTARIRCKKFKRINICDLLLKSKNTDSFLKIIITGDEKWIVYDNIVRKRSWCKLGEPT